LGIWKALPVVHRDRPERGDRRQLTGVETEDVVPVADDGVALGVGDQQGIHGVLDRVGTQAGERDHGPREVPVAVAGHRDLRLTLAQGPAPCIPTMDVRPHALGFPPKTSSARGSVIPADGSPGCRPERCRGRTPSAGPAPVAAAGIGPARRASRIR
jgi:hypothetical protein